MYRERSVTRVYHNCITYVVYCTLYTAYITYTSHIIQLLVHRCTSYVVHIIYDDIRCTTYDLRSTPYISSVVWRKVVRHRIPLYDVHRMTYCGIRYMCDERYTMYEVRYMTYDVRRTPYIFHSTPYIVVVLCTTLTIGYLLINKRHTALLSFINQPASRVS